MHHLGKSPGTQGGQDNDAEQVHRVGTEKAGQKALASLKSGNGNIICGDQGQLMDGIEESAVSFQDGQDDRGDTEEHDDTLNKIVECGCHVSADDDIYTGQDCHDNEADTVGDIKSHSEEAGKAVVDGSSVGDQEYKRDHAAGDLQRLGLKALAEEIGHCA